MNANTTQKGFTLIELSVVLIITGLIIGGVLMGRMLVRAAEIRATIAQKTSYDAAMNTFRVKYQHLPGDIPPAKAAAFDFFALGGPSAGTLGFADGNSLYGEAGATQPEHLIFWRHLSEANLIKGSYGANAANRLDPNTGFPTIAETNTAYFLPPTDFNGQVFFIPIAYNGKNYYWLTGLSGLPATGSYSGIYRSTLTPAELFELDSKIDDGMPNSGSVLGFGSYNAVADSQSCLTGGTGTDTRYNIDPALGADDPGPFDVYNPNTPALGGKICFLYMRADQ